MHSVNYAIRKMDHWGIAVLSLVQRGQLFLNTVSTQKDIPRNQHNPQISLSNYGRSFFINNTDRKKTLLMFSSHPSSFGNPDTSNYSHCFQWEGRKRGKSVWGEIQQHSLSQTTGKCISHWFLPVSQHPNRRCPGTSQQLMQTTSELNLCKKKKKKRVCFCVLVSPYLVSGFLFKSTLSNCVDFSWRFFFCLLVCFGEEGGCNFPTYGR